jgi:hypothetical protein
VPVFELFSTRKKALQKSGKPDVYVYDKMPVQLRTQIQQIFHDAVGPYYEYGGHELRHISCNNDAWQFFLKTICRERGLHRLNEGYTPYSQLMDVIASAQNVDEVLDIVELVARYVDRLVSPMSKPQYQLLGITQDPREALEELNHRFAAAGVGYRYESGALVRMDSQYLHDEVVKPALSLLLNAGFAGPQAEFIEAHTHFRNGNNKDAITWAGKAFESTMKTICDRKGWAYPSGARSSDLLKVLRSNKLWPDYLDASFDQLLATLGSGLPKVRNMEGAHGDGAIPKQTPEYVAGYALHLAAAKIVFMVRAAGLG